MCGTDWSVAYSLLEDLAQRRHWKGWRMDEHAEAAAARPAEPTGS
jgi:hypothetical protein